MMDIKAVGVIDIIRDRINGKLLYEDDKRGSYIWYVSGENGPKKILTVFFHSGLGYPYWSVTADGSEHDYVRMCVPHSRGTAEFVAEQILSAWL